MLCSLLYADLTFVFFFNDTATTEIYTLSLHDALPILFPRQIRANTISFTVFPEIVPSIGKTVKLIDRKSGSAGMPRPISYAVFCLKKKKIRTITMNDTLHDGHKAQPYPNARVLKSYVH